MMGPLNDAFDWPRNLVSPNPCARDVWQPFRRDDLLGGIDWLLISRVTPSDDRQKNQSRARHRQRTRRSKPMTRLRVPNRPGAFKHAREPRRKPLVSAAHIIEQSPDSRFLSIEFHKALPPPLKAAAAASCHARSEFALSQATRPLRPRLL